MTTLNIASKANQATTIPALLIATYAKESDSNATVKVNFEDVDILKSGDKASVELVQGSSASTYGCENVVGELLSTFPFLQGKHVDLVSVTQANMSISDSQMKGQGVARSTAGLLRNGFQSGRRARTGARFTPYAAISCSGL